MSTTIRLTSKVSEAQLAQSESDTLRNLGDGVTRTYSSGIIYSALGGMTKEKFGTTTPIYNKLFYNSRGQLSEIRESSSYAGPTDTTWNRGAIINHYSDTCWDHSQQCNPFRQLRQLGNKHGANQLASHRPSRTPRITFDLSASLYCEVQVNITGTLGQPQALHNTPGTETLQALLKKHVLW